jgi:hypothetical protein
MQATSPEEGVTNATAFGLDVRSRIELPFLEGARTQPSGRVLDVSAGHNDAAALAWRGSVEPLCDQRDVQGEVVLRIEAHPREGYLLWGAGHGAYLLDAGGRRLRCDVRECRPEAWQRLLVAQALPFAALLQGLEALHASAVGWEGGAVALNGPSGAGKTSVALELCRLGACFLADDVVALEPRDGELLAHPGTPLAGLDRGEAERLERAGRAHAYDVIATNPRERLLRVTPLDRPLPLVALFLLERSDRDCQEPSFEALDSARSLLASSFNFVLDQPERLRGLLDTCALAACCRVERVLCGPGVDATDVAQAIARRLLSSP